MIKVLGIKSNNLSRMSLALEETLKLYQELVKRSDEESIYGVIYHISTSVLKLNRQRKVRIFHIV